MSPSFSLGVGLSISTKVRFGNPYVDPYSIGGKLPPLVLDFIGTFSSYAYETLEPPLVLDFKGDRS